MGLHTNTRMQFLQLRAHALARQRKRHLHRVPQQYKDINTTLRCAFQHIIEPILLRGLSIAPKVNLRGQKPAGNKYLPARRPQRLEHSAKVRRAIDERRRHAAVACTRKRVEARPGARRHLHRQEDAPHMLAGRAPTPCAHAPQRPLARQAQRHLIAARVCASGRCCRRAGGVRVRTAVVLGGHEAATRVVVALAPPAKVAAQASASRSRRRRRA